LATDWIGKGNRESQTLPVLDLRESAQKVGLLRKHRGKLLLTAQGRAMRSDPVALWSLLAGKTPPRAMGTGSPSARTGPGSAGWTKCGGEPDRRFALLRRELTSYM
jgi:hypothetical protein